MTSLTLRFRPGTIAILADLAEADGVSLEEYAREAILCVAMLDAWREDDEDAKMPELLQV